MNFEKVKAAFLKLFQKKDATPYIAYIKAGISETENKIRPEFKEDPPDCVNLYAAAIAILMYTNANCAGDTAVCNEEGSVLLNKDTDNIRKSAAYFADYCLSLCSKYLIDDKFVMISTKGGASS